MPIVLPCNEFHQPFMACITRDAFENLLEEYDDGFVEEDHQDVYNDLHPELKHSIMNASCFDYHQDVYNNLHPELKHSIMDASCDNYHQDGYNDLHPELKHLYSIMDANDRKLFIRDINNISKKINTIRPLFSGGNYVTVFDNDRRNLLRDRNISRIIFKVTKLKNDHPDIIIKATPVLNSIEKKKEILNKIRALSEIPKNNTLKEKINKLKDYSYIQEAFFYKITQFLNEDKVLYDLNGNTPLFFKFYDSFITSIDKDTKNLNINYNGENIKLFLRPHSVISRTGEERTANFDGMNNWQITIIEAAKPDYKSCTEKTKSFAVCNLIVNIVMYLYNKYSFVHADLHCKNFLIKNKDEINLKIFDFDKAFLNNNGLKIYGHQEEYIKRMKKILPKKFNDAVLMGVFSDFGNRIKLHITNSEYDKIKEFAYENDVITKNDASPYYVMVPLIGYLFYEAKVNGNIILKVDNFDKIKIIRDKYFFP